MVHSLLQMPLDFKQVVFGRVQQDDKLRAGGSNRLHQRRTYISTGPRYKNTPAGVSSSERTAAGLSQRLRKKACPRAGFRTGHFSRLVARKPVPKPFHETNLPLGLPVRACSEFPWSSGV